jgi:hypothetical protein
LRSLRRLVLGGRADKLGGSGNGALTAEACVPASGRRGRHARELGVGTEVDGRHEQSDAKTNLGLGGAWRSCRGKVELG